MPRMFPLLVLLLAGCVALPRAKHARIGMTRAQVVALLGKPDATDEIFQSDVEALTYVAATRPPRPGQPPPEPGKRYSVVLRSGRVTWQGTDMEKKITLTPGTARGFVPVRNPDR